MYASGYRNKRFTILQSVLDVVSEPANMAKDPSTATAGMDGDTGIAPSSLF